MLGQLRRPRIDQQATAQLRIGTVHGDIKRREPLLLDALPVGRAEIGEGEIGAVEEAEPIVVVLEVKTSALAWRLLVDEAEGAVVVALPQAVEQGLTELDPEPVVGILLKAHALAHPLGILHLQGDLLVPKQQLQIDQVARAHAVDGQQPIAGLQAKFLTDRPGFNAGDHRGVRQALGTGAAFRRVLGRSAGGQGDAGRGFLPHGLVAEDANGLNSVCLQLRPPAPRRKAPRFPELRTWISASAPQRVAGSR